MRPGTAALGYRCWFHAVVVVRPREIRILEAAGKEAREQSLPPPDADDLMVCPQILEQIFQMKHIGLDQLHWPDLDMDIELDALRRPENYPLVWREPGAASTASHIENLVTA